MRQETPCLLWVQTVQLNCRSTANNTMCIAQSNKGPAPIKSGFWLFFSTFYILSFRTVDFFFFYTFYLCHRPWSLHRNSPEGSGLGKKGGGGGGGESN